MQLTTRFQAVPRLAPVSPSRLAAPGSWRLAIIGCQPKFPPPFGLASNGSLAYDTRDEIFVSNQDGTNVRPLIEGVVHASSPTWSPDGTHIAFWGDESPDSLFVADANGGNVRNVTSRVWISTDKPPTWSPDDRFIAFSAESGPNKEDERLFVVEIATGAVTPVGPHGPVDVRSFFPSWSPDGNWIAFVGVPPAPGNDMGLWVVRPNGLERHRLPTSPVVELAQPQWAPSADRLRLVYAADNSTGTNSDVYVLDVAAGVETMISSGSADNRGPTWSPDGTRIAWLARFAVAASNRVDRLAGDGDRRAIRWDRHAAGVVARWHKGLRIRLDIALLPVVTVDGSSPTVRITHAPAQGSPAWQRLAR